MLVWVNISELQFIKHCHLLYVFSTKAHEKKKSEKMQCFIHWCNVLSQLVHFIWHTVT